MSDNPESLKQFIREHKLEAMSVTVPDLHGIARGKKVPARRLLESAASPMRMSNLMVMLDYAGMPHPPPENDDRWWPSWNEGYADTRMVVDPATARIVPWQPATGLVLGDFEHVDGRGILEYLPRATLKRLLRRLADRGFESRASIEMEFMLLDETHGSVAEKGYRNLKPLWSTPQAYRLTTLGIHDERLSGMSRALEGFGLPVEAWNAEAGPGQVEINLAPAAALDAADQGFLFKHGVKELAAAGELFATFIAKLSPHGFGNGTHLNFSLWREGENAFHSPSSETGMSPVMRHFVAGLVRTLPEFTLMYAPTVNAYRRFVPYFSTGMMLSWGFDNKSNAIRCVTESPSLTRIEQRTAGGDANPYLLLAACIAAGLYGIDNELEPPPPTLGDAYADTGLGRVPATMEQALDLFEASEVANAYLGEDFVRFYAHSRRIECQCFAEATEGVEADGVTDWEVARYLEMV